MSIRSILQRLALWLFVAVVLFSTATALLADLGKVRGLLGSITISWLLCILGAVLFNYLLRFLKWTWFLHLLRIDVPLGDSLWVFFSAFTMVLSPGKLGEVVKSVLLKSRHGIPVTRTAPIVLAERITDLCGLLVLAVIGSSRFAYGADTLAVVGGLLVLGILAMTQSFFWRLIDRHILARVQMLHRLRDSFHVLEESTQHLLSLRSLLLTVPLSALSWAGEGVALYFIFQSMGVGLANLLAVSIFAHAFSSIVGALSFLPGGLLVTEGALGLFFVYVGVARDASISATLMIRAVTLWFAVILGTIVFLLGRRPHDLAWHSPSEAPASIPSGDSHES